MVANLPLADAFDLQEKLEDVEGVQGVAFDETDEHYNNVSALFSVTFDSVSYTHLDVYKRQAQATPARAGAAGACRRYRASPPPRRQ